MIDTTLIAKLQAEHEERLLYWRDDWYVECFCSEINPEEL